MRRTPQQWLTLFKIQNESPLSVKQFCLEQGISTSNFYKNKAASATSIAPTAMTSPSSQVHLVEPEQKSVLDDNEKSLLKKDIQLNKKDA
ncbi:MAG: hypothetical protein ACJAWS_000694 [Oleiphilaceae bacterium]|jgi:hypothetical protein